MTEVVVAPSPRRKKGGRVAIVLVGLVLFSLLALALVVYFALPGFLLRAIEKEAKRQGVVLSECSLDYSLDHLTLSSCRFELAELPGVNGTLGTVEVAIEDFEAKQVVVKEPVISVRELPDMPTGELVPRWLEQRSKVGKGSKVPIRIERARLDLFGASGEGEQDNRPLVSLTELNYDSTTEAIDSKINIGGMIDGTFGHKDTRSELDVHLKMSPSTKGRFSIETQTDGAEVRADFEQLPLAVFSIPPFIVLPDALTTVQLDGQLYARVPFGLSTEGIRGDFRTTLSGLVMPVPREIEGLVTGPAPVLEGKFKVHPNNQQVNITKLTLKAGVLQLSGNAELEVRSTGIPLDAQLSGSLSCGAILEAATRAHTDSPLAIAAAQLARKGIKGGVGIVIVLDADLLRLREAKLLRTIGVGCGLKPFPLPEGLEKLGERVLKGLPQPPSLPDLPELKLPDQMPEPPRFRLPGLPGFDGDKQLTDPAPSAAPQSTG